ncbi:hypothetical protein PIB30_034862 [Stylosanthes scabra]|uniref:Uncharacterized protein n=1 Tax=Stylosanthes scabra TaxID=79078 RepID=A0ABU6QD12_9FABA|nr:hypothetical protein [Stylosanthes scabra]
MAGGDVTLNRLRHLTRPSASVGAAIPVTPVVGHAGSGPSLTARVITPPGPTPEVIITPEQGSSNDGGRGVGEGREISSLVRNDEQQVSPPSFNRLSAPMGSSAAKRQRMESSTCEFNPLDRSFDAPKFITENFWDLGLRRPSGTMTPWRASDGYSGPCSNPQLL